MSFIAKNATAHKVNSYYTLTISYCTFCVGKHTILGPGVSPFLASLFPFLSPPSNPFPFSLPQSSRPKIAGVWTPWTPMDWRLRPLHTQPDLGYVQSTCSGPHCVNFPALMYRNMPWIQRYTGPCSFTACSLLGWQQPVVEFCSFHGLSDRLQELVD